VLPGRHLGVVLVHDDAPIALIAEIGLILLLFIIGLEINVREVARAGRVIIVSGLLQAPLCAALAWVIFGGLTDATGGRFDRIYLVVAVEPSAPPILL